MCFLVAYSISRVKTVLGQITQKVVNKNGGISYSHNVIRAHQNVKRFRNFRLFLSEGGGMGD